MTPKEIKQQQLPSPIKQKTNMPPPNKISLTTITNYLHNINFSCASFCGKERLKKENKYEHSVEPVLCLRLELSY